MRKQLLLKTKMKFWQKLSLLGVKDKYSDESNKKRIFLNRILVVIILMTIIGLVFDLIHLYNTEKTFTIGYLGVYIVVFLGVFHLVLNAYGFFKLSRNLIFIDIPFFFLFFAPLTGDVILDSFFYGPYMPIAFSVVLYFVFDTKKDSRKLLSFLLLYLLIIILFDNIAYMLSPKKHEIYDMIKSVYIIYKSSPVLIFVFVNISLYYAFSLTKTYENKLEGINTELKETKKELIKLNATKNKFFQIISHDLKNPISLVVNYAELIELKHNELSEKELNTFFAILKDASQKGLKLLDNLLSWAQVHTGQLAYTPSLFNLNNEIDTNISLLNKVAENKHIQLTNSINENIEIFADINMLNTILRNLITNAIKFTYPEGKIIISAKETTEFIRISIQDTGIGMQKAEIDKLFKIESGFSTEGTNHESGTGIGLILCKEFVDKHQGEIFVESELGKGTNFTVSIPNNKI